MKKIKLYAAILLISVSAALPVSAAQTKQATNSLDAYAPFEELLQISPSNSTTYSPPLRGCMIETAGDLVIETIKGSGSVTLTVIVGQLVPAIITKVNASTTATLVCGR